jgi:hypothetical protein
LGGTTSGTAIWSCNVLTQTANNRGDERTNDALAIGGSETEVKPWGRSTIDTFQPKLTTVLSLIDEIDEARLQNHAVAETNVNEVSQVREYAVLAGGNLDLGAFNPGDLVRTVTPPGMDPWEPDGLDDVQRTVGFKVEVPGTGGKEIVSLITEAGEGSA